MKDDFFDMHTHTTRSDGEQSPETVVKSAVQAGLRHVCISDHDRDFPAELRRALSRRYKIDVIGGCEFNAAVTLSSGRRLSVHIIAPWLNAASPAVAAVLKKNQDPAADEAYCKAMLQKLLALGIDVSGKGIDASWEMLRSENPDTLHLGKGALARLMVEKGWCKTQREAKDLYLSQFGQRLAYVDSIQYHDYASIEEVMAAINTCTIGILAHLGYYQLKNEKEERELLTKFQTVGGVGLEVDYGNYSEEYKAHLAAYAREFDLLPSAASDRHLASSPFQLGNPAWFRALRSRCLELHGSLYGEE